MIGNASRTEFRWKRYAARTLSVRPDELAMLTRSSDTPVDESADDGDSERNRIGIGEDRRFSAQGHAEFPEYERFTPRGSAASSATVSLGPECSPCKEQFAVNVAGSGLAWHQDSIHVGFDHDHHLGVRVARGDTTTENGRIRLPEGDLDRDCRVDAWIKGTWEPDGHFGGGGERNGDRLHRRRCRLEHDAQQARTPNMTDRHRRARYVSAPLRNPARVN